MEVDKAVFAVAKDPPPSAPPPPPFPPSPGGGSPANSGGVHVRVCACYLVRTLAVRAPPTCKGCYFPNVCCRFDGMIVVVVVLVKLCVLIR